MYGNRYPVQGPRPPAQPTRRPYSTVSGTRRPPAGYPSRQRSSSASGQPCPCTAVPAGFNFKTRSARPYSAPSPCRAPGYGTPDSRHAPAAHGDGRSGNWEPAGRGAPRRRRPVGRALGKRPPGDHRQSGEYPKDPAVGLKREVLALSCSGRKTVL